MNYLFIYFFQKSHQIPKVVTAFLKYSRQIIGLSIHMLILRSLSVKTVSVFGDMWAFLCNCILVTAHISHCLDVYQ